MHDTERGAAANGRRVEQADTEPHTQAAGAAALRLAAGRLTAALASAATMRSGLGTGPWDTLFSATHARYDVGYAALSAAAALGFAALARAHGARPHPMMVVHALAGGLLVQGVLRYLPPAPTPAAAWAYAVAALALGVQAGVLVLGAPLARTAYDGALVAVSARRRWGVARTRLCLDLPALAAGWAMGGRVGAGTVVAALLTGPLVQAVLRRHPDRRAGWPTVPRARPAAPAVRLTPFEPARAVA